MFSKQLLRNWSLGLLCASATLQAAEAPAAYGPVPTEQQVNWLRMEWYAFVHFGLNTYTNKEWGYGDESPTLFNPSSFDAETIVETFKGAGMNGMIYTAKHHDGFCTWPTKSTKHNITKSPWKNGKGDVVKEFAKACKKHKFAFGTYLSPWDRNCAEYGKPGYLDVYYKQIEELLTNYGPIFEIWFDGAMGGDGYYGGARQNRNIGKADTYYNYEQVVKNIRKLQPNCIIWGAAGRGDATWAGSEQGYARNYPLWNSRNGKWICDEADTPINHRGWFWHPGQASAVKSPEHLMKVYLMSVGRGANLILNVAPDRSGRLDPADVASLQAFGKMRRELLAKDYALNAKVVTSEARGKKYNGSRLTDGDIESYWCPEDGTTSATAELQLEKPVTFDVVRLREQIRLGQRVEAFQVDAWVNGEWKTIVHPGLPGENENAPARGQDWLKFVRGGKGHTIGNQVMRWLTEPVTTDKVRLTITRAKACPCISEFSLLMMPAAEQAAPTTTESGDKVLDSRGWEFGGFAGNMAHLAFDGKADTMWQHGKTPSHFRVDMKKAYTLNGFAYLPRQDGKTQGMTSRYRFEISMDGSNWKVVSEGEFGNLRANPVEQQISFPAQKARYVRFFSTAALDGSGSSVAELKLLSPR
ncbi:MAG: alpha-L-fucosidase [Akkermansia sp.]|nr:alpha-L-fucosidase [Akkermansia sp.]MBR3944961.1 alpha-L-fucosidase [Akkermansia sp.]